MSQYKFKSEFFRHLRIIYDRLGMIDYDLSIIEHVDNNCISIRLSKTFDNHQLKYGSIDKIIENLIEPMLNSERYKDLVKENLELKKLLDKDPCEGLNLNWD